jgi:hypothetical protein
MSSFPVVGLFMRTNAFHGVSHVDVRAALAEFWSRHDRQVQPTPEPRVDAFALHEQRDGWTVLDWTRGWEWTLRRQAQLHVSEALGCTGLLVFVYDGDYWGYELFDRGAAVDWFVQWPQEGNSWFPGKDLRGRPDAVVAAFPDLALDPADVTAYLLQYPDGQDDEQRWQDEELWNVPARLGDRFSRGEDCAVLDFLGLLGVAVDVTERGVTWRAPLWHRFLVEPPIDQE